MWKSWLKKTYEILKAAVYGFIKDECYVKASALTFYSLLSIVPSLAIVFGIAKGFGFQQILETEFRSVFHEQKEVADYLIYFVYHLLEEAQGNVIAGVGIVALLWAALKLLESIEHTLNDIWKVKTPRTYVRKFADYFATLFMSIIFVIAASSITVYLSSKLHSYVTHYESLQPIYTIWLFMLPLILSWAFFSFLYIFLPNTRVPWYSAVIAGVFGGTLYQLTQFFYIKFQIGVASYGAIYGSFAALPLFLIWLQTSWVIVLFGAEVAYFCDKYSPIFRQYSAQVKTNEKVLAILTMMLGVRQFSNLGGPLNAALVSKEFGVTLDIASSILEKLCESRLLVVVRINNQDGYQPGMPLEALSIIAVLNNLTKVDDKLVTLREIPELSVIEKILADFEKLEEKSSSNALLKDLIANK